jgi:excisionase family DNA binding protein
MESSLYLSSGKAARALGANADAIRRLCAAGGIEAEITPGGQWRIPTEEIERLKEEGIPPVPKPMPGQSKRGAPAASAAAAPIPPTGPSVLLAEPSEETVAAADEVVRLKVK